MRTGELESGLARLAARPKCPARRSRPARPQRSGRRPPRTCSRPRAKREAI